MQEKHKWCARKSPEWLNKSVIYQVFLRSFTAKGTLKAAEQHLEKVAELGVDIVYLCPICLQDDDMRVEYWSDRQKASGMNNPKNPYRIKDYYSIDPEYGTDADLESFVEKAHALGLRVLLDLVYFHCGPCAVFIDEHPDFVTRDSAGNVNYGVWHFPILNFESMVLREYLWENMEYWVKNFDIDGYRCDVAPEIPLDFWENARDRLERIKPDIVMVSEGDKRVEEQLKAFDLNYNFTWTEKIRNVFEKKESISILRKIEEEMKAERPVGTRFVYYIDTHDWASDDGIMRLEKKWGTKAVKAVLVFLLTGKGVPFLYNGQEIADDTHHSIYGHLPIDWKKAETDEGRARFAFCQNLIAMRRREKALTEGELIWLDNGKPDMVVSFLRKTEDEEILVIINLSAEKVHTWIEMSSVNYSNCSELLSSNALYKDCKIENKRIIFELDDFSYFIAKFLI